MQKELVITFVGDDRPGIVQDMSQRVTARGGNWLESQMTRLAGKFAGVARVSVPDTVFAGLVQDLESMPGISVMLEAPTESPEDLQALSFVLSIIGPDQTFFAEAKILVPASVSMTVLQDQLNEIADALALDIRLE
jgi:glycine cleavage system regulatory protein